jgi:hypothetical protein
MSGGGCEGARGLWDDVEDGCGCVVRVLGNVFSFSGISWDFLALYNVVDSRVAKLGS